MPNPDVSLGRTWKLWVAWACGGALRCSAQPWSQGPRASCPRLHTHCPRFHCRLVTHRLGRQDESAEAGGGGMRVLQIPAMPLDRMWGHGPVPPLEGALELLHEQAARQHAQRNPGVCTAHTHGHPTTPGALIMGP